MQIDGHTRMAAVIAQPIKHSLSPFIHNLGYSLTGVNAVYLAWEVGEKDLEESIKNIRRYDMLGANLSMPFKQAVLPYLDQISPVASMIGAVNTIQNVNGHLIGHNTDGLGFFSSLGDFSIKGKKMLIIGSGGAARALICQALLDSLLHLVIVDKPAYQEATKTFFAPLCKEYGVYFDLISPEDLPVIQKELEGTDLLVQATSRGMDGQTMALDPTLTLNPQTLVADLIYQPRETPFLAWAKAQGNETTNGLGMLLYQAAAAFELMTGQALPLDKVEPAFLEKINAKGEDL